MKMLKMPTDFRNLAFLLKIDNYQKFYDTNGRQGDAYDRWTEL